MLSVVGNATNRTVALRDNESAVTFSDTAGISVSIGKNHKDKDLALYAKALAHLSKDPLFVKHVIQRYHTVTHSNYSPHDDGPRVA